MGWAAQELVPQLAVDAAFDGLRLTAMLFGATRVGTTKRKWNAGARAGAELELSGPSSSVELNSMS